MRQKLAEFVEKRLPEFHRSRIDSLEGLRLGEVLKRKNPYLFRAKNSGSADELVGDVLDAFLSSKEETVFGGLLESIAVKEPLVKSHMAARSAFRDGMQGTVRSEWPFPFASAATQQTARKTSAHAGFDKNSPDSRHATQVVSVDTKPRSITKKMGYSCQNAAHGGLNQGFLKAFSLAYGGKKSSAEGIDLEFERDGTLYLVAIKSGPNWGNSQQIKRMQDNFRRAKKVLQTNTMRRHVVAVNGCCYGRDNHPDKSEYLKLCGEGFWALISGDDLLFVDLVDPLGKQAKERNEEFRHEYAKVRNRFTRQFIDEYCTTKGEIDWHRIVRVSSAKRESKK